MTHTCLRSPFLPLSKYTTIGGGEVTACNAVREVRHTYYFGPPAVHPVAPAPAPVLQFCRGEHTASYPTSAVVLH